MKVRTQCVAILFALIALAGASISVQAENPRRAVAHVPAGAYMPLYATAGTPVHVKAFTLDRYPVTRGQYLAFVTSHPEWRRSAVHVAGYLRDWTTDARYGSNADRDRLVTNVPLAAARAFCVAQGGRLPGVDEWEYVAAASETRRNGYTDVAFRQRLLDLYSRPRSDGSRHVGTGMRNVYGVGDMHGIVWEWTEARPHQHGSNHKHDMSCAGSASGASDPRDFAAFLRYAFRSGLTESTTADNLGFRCAGGA